MTVLVKSHPRAIKELRLENTNVSDVISISFPGNLLSVKVIVYADGKLEIMDKDKFKIALMGTDESTIIELVQNYLVKYN